MVLIMRGFIKDIARTFFNENWLVDRVLICLALMGTVSFIGAVYMAVVILKN